MKRMKVFFNDLLALAFACVISLLFTHGVTQFVYSSSKKSNENRLSLTPTTVFNEADVLYLSETTNNYKSPVEAFHNVETGIVNQTESYKTLRAVILNIGIAWKRINSHHCNFTSLYRYNLPDVWSPSICIAQRRLLI